jgi:pantothenate kinase
MEVVVRQLMTRGFTREGAEQLLKGAPVTASNDTIRTLRPLSLQDQMQKRAQVYQTLTNLLKMQHDRATAVIRNIKG